jgi:hypothetical protein
MSELPHGESNLPHGESHVPQTRRTRRGGLLAQPYTAKLVASQLSIRSDQLRGNGLTPGEHDGRSGSEKAADIDLAELLDVAAEELRAVS